MDEKEKAIKLIREIRKREDYAISKKRFCREQRFDLDEIKFEAIEQELNKVCSMIQLEFETGYVPSENNN